MGSANKKGEKLGVLWGYLPRLGNEASRQKTTHKKEGSRPRIKSLEALNGRKIVKNERWRSISPRSLQKESWDCNSMRHTTYSMRQTKKPTKAEKNRLVGKKERTRIIRHAKSSKRKRTSKKSRKMNAPFRR